MGRPRLSDPVKHCAQCGARMERKRFNGTLEARSNFRARKFCDQECMALNMVKDAPTLGALRQRARQYRKSTCERCGSAENLHVHHVDTNPANNDPQNLKTLCGSCHLKLHWRELGRTAGREKPSCKICGEPAKGHGLCLKHYQRFKKHGDPLLTKRGGTLLRVSPEF